MITLVIVQHLAITYSGLGDWYYKEPANLGFMQYNVFLFYLTFTQGYFMGILFFIAGHFIPASYDRKGFRKFIKDRLVRLGVPTVFYIFIINPIITDVIMGFMDSHSFFQDYAKNITSLRFIGDTGPLWFTFALLAFTVFYAVFRKIVFIKVNARKDKVPGTAKIIALALFIGVCTFCVRAALPVGTVIFNMRLGYFAQYIILFIVGIISKRNEWLEKLTYAKGRPWMITALALGLLRLALLFLNNDPNADYSAYNGGLNPQSAFNSLWESFVSVSMSIGLIAVFKEKMKAQNKLIKAMSENAFAVFVFHAPVIVALTQLFAPVHLYPALKFIILVFSGIPICFLLTHFTVRKIPALKKMTAG